MSLARSSLLWAVAAFSTSLFSAGGCATGAVAISECRELEYIRCEASVHCGILEKSEVTECKRFYKDQCLHGIEGSEAPSAEEHKKCKESLEAAASCAEQDPKMAPKSCKGLTSTQDDSRDVVVDVCDVVGRPWDILVCGYIDKQKEAEPDANGGAGGSQ